MKNSESLTKQDRVTLRNYGMDFEKLTNCAARTYGFGEQIVSEGLPNDFLFLVTGGRAKVGVSAPNGKSIILCFYISEGLMGEAEYFSGSKVGCTTVTALENLRCILIPIHENKAYLDSNLDFTRVAAAALAGKLLQRANNVIENTLYTAEMRLCRYILDASDGDRFRDVMMHRGVSQQTQSLENRRKLYEACGNVKCIDPQYGHLADRQFETHQQGTSLADFPFECVFSRKVIDTFFSCSHSPICHQIRNRNPRESTVAPVFRLFPRRRFSH